MNKPVAWMHRETGEFVVFGHIPKHDWWIPLYTHPVNPYQSITDTKIEPTVVSYTHPVKELTDEEITAIWQTDECYQKAQVFARAILKKANEK